MSLIRTDTDYAIRALLCLARSGGSMSCGPLAADCDIPRSFAHKILKSLARAGMVRSQTGRCGGFSLCKDPKTITLLEVAQAIQGPVLVRQCVLDSDACSRNKDCPVCGEWRRLQDSIATFLSRTSIADTAAALKCQRAARKTARA
jgi:Rrf2 family protein